MSEKRFTLMLPNAIINDTIVRKSYYLSEKDDVEKLVGVLNDQQATIQSLRKWIQAEQKQVEKRDAFLKEKGVLREFCEKMAQNYEGGGMMSKKQFSDLNDLQAVIEELEEKIGEQQATINLLLDLLYQSEATVINEYSSNIGEDMEKLDKIFKEKDIEEIKRFVRGCDDE